MSFPHASVFIIAVWGKSLFGEICVDQCGEDFDCLLFIVAVSNDADVGSLDYAEGKHAKQALGIDAALVLFDPDAALELIGLLDEKGGRSCVEAHLVINNRSLDIHHDTPFR